jgi:hypothetical protein
MTDLVVVPMEGKQHLIYLHNGRILIDPKRIRLGSIGGGLGPFSRFRSPFLGAGIGEYGRRFSSLGGRFGGLGGGFRGGFSGLMGERGASRGTYFR